MATKHGIQMIKLEKFLITACTIKGDVKAQFNLGYMYARGD
jgi:TPR repeat protein